MRLRKPPKIGSDYKSARDGRQPPLTVLGLMSRDSFATLLNRKRLLEARNEAYLAIDPGFLGSLLAPTLATIYIDEPRYLMQFPDVAKAVLRGHYTAEHPAMAA